MALSSNDINAVVESIIHGSEEKYVAELTDTIISEFERGLMYSAEVDLYTLARTYPAKASAILIKYKDQINQEVLDEIQTVLDAAVTEDLASLASVYGVVQAAEYATDHFKEISRQTAEGVRQIIERQNVALSQSLQDTWYKVSADAVTAINHGLKPRSQVLAEGVVKLMDAGISVVPYQRNGKRTVTNHVDVALRRHITTQVSQAGGRMSLEVMDLYGHDLVITDAHYGARPEHAEWQGIPCSRTGRKTIDGVTYPDLVMFTGYGSVTGLKGANCRHMMTAYYPGISRLPDREFKAHEAKFGKTSEEYYQATQRQRELERRIRKTKREIAGLEKAGVGLESPVYVQKRLVLGKQQKTIKQFCKENKLTRLYEREKAYGVMKQPRALRGSKWNTKKHYAYPRASETLLNDVHFPKPDRELINALQEASNTAISDMTIDELNALMKYTTGAHNIINQRLYGKKISKKKENLADSCIKEIDRALSKFKLEKDVAVYSGTNAKHYTDFNVGQEYVIDGFLSTSVRHKDAREFFDREAANGEEPLLLRISIPKDTKCLFVGDNTGYFKYQGEMILSRGLRYRMVERKGHTLYLEVVPND